MTAYEFYWHDETGLDRLIGILPERRKDPKRITPESIMNWARLIVANNKENKRVHDIYFVQVEI